VGVLSPALADELAALGPFFAVEFHSVGSPVVAPWRPMGELTHDAAALRERVLAVRGHLATAGGRPVEGVPPRVAASVAQLGLVARLVSPALGCALLAGAVPNLALAGTRWQPVLGGAFPLSIQEPAPPEHDPGREWVEPVRGGLPDLADQLARRVLDGPVRELVQASVRYSVSAVSLQGNAASAVNGAASVVGASRPDRAGSARELAALLLARPPLRGTGTWTADGGFRRRSCCLIYQVAASPGAVCGDCVLRRD
jgi:FhuF 2Fe-2S C-terminal domain